jgi:hypothetical protein
MKKIKKIEKANKKYEEKVKNVLRSINSDGSRRPKTKELKDVTSSIYE